MAETLYKTEAIQIEVEIYETGEKKLIAGNKHILQQKTKQNRSLIITAAVYKSYSADILATTEV